MRQRTTHFRVLLTFFLRNFLLVFSMFRCNTKFRHNLRCLLGFPFLIFYRNIYHLCPFIMWKNSVLTGLTRLFCWCARNVKNKIDQSRTKKQHTTDTKKMFCEVITYKLRFYEAEKLVFTTKKAKFIRRKKTNYSQEMLTLYDDLSHHATDNFCFMNADEIYVYVDKTTGNLFNKNYDNLSAYNAKKIVVSNMHIVITKIKNMFVDVKRLSPAKNTK